MKVWTRAQPELVLQLGKGALREHEVIGLETIEGPDCRVRIGRGRAKLACYLRLNQSREVYHTSVGIVADDADFECSHACVQGCLLLYPLANMAVDREARVVCLSQGVKGVYLREEWEENQH